MYRHLTLSAIAAVAGFALSHAASAQSGDALGCAVSGQSDAAASAQRHQPYPYPVLPYPTRRPEPPETIPEWVDPCAELLLAEEAVVPEQVASAEVPRPESPSQDRAAPEPRAPEAEAQEFVEPFELVRSPSLPPPSEPVEPSAPPSLRPVERPLTEPPALSRGLNIEPAAAETDGEASEFRDLEVAAEDLALLPGPGESIVQLPNSEGYRILFSQGSPDLTMAGGTLLEGLAERMIASPGLWVQVRAFASNSPDGPGNARSLSLNRALLIRSFLIDRGVRSTRVDIRALGNSSETGPQDRVDLIFSN